MARNFILKNGYSGKFCFVYYTTIKIYIIFPVILIHFTENKNTNHFYILDRWKRRKEKERGKNGKNSLYSTSKVLNATELYALK